MRNSFVRVGGRANKLTVMSSMLSILVCALLGAGLTSAKIELFEARKAGYAADANVLRHVEARDSHFTQEEILDSLTEQNSRLRRQAADPLRNDKYVFEDGYGYGAVHYSGDKSDVVFVLTYNLDRNGNPTATNLYRSTDYGVNFDNIEEQLDNNPLLWHSFFVSPVNKNMLVFASYTQSRIYFTRDEGDTWDHRDLNPASLDRRSLKFSPKEDNWILAHDPDNERLYVSTDLGSSWTLVADNVDHSSDYQWGDPDWETDDSTIYFNKFDPSDTDRGNHTVSLYTQHYPYGPDTQKVFDPNLGRHEAFLLDGPYIFVQKTESNDDAHLLVSYNRQPFNMALIPTPYHHRNYIVSHINGRQAQVIVEHEGDFFNLYLSDVTGVYFSLSLRDIVVTSSGIDLERIDGLNGTMIANQYVRDSPGDNTDLKRTLLTLDNGGNWELIHPPDVDGDPVNCEPPLCSLHFHMDTSDYARLGIFSTESAPGIIIAHGTLGETLSDNPDLYISRDGGISWHETLSGSYGATVLDHGGIIVAVNDYHQVPSTQLKYSCNEGISWSEYAFSDTSITIFGVITEPGEHTTNLSLYGVEIGGSNWVVVTLDFDPIFGRDCRDNDYYEWLPWDDRSGTGCILGSSVEIERREIATCCRNGRDYTRESHYTICECNEEDFECDYGYARPGEDLTGLCVRDPDTELKDPCKENNATSYMASTGYRKIAGDVCSGGVEILYAPFLAQCCGGSTEPPTQNTPDIQYTTESSRSKDDNTKVVIGGTLGVLVALVTIVAGVLLIFVIVLAIKYTGLKRRHTQLITGEPSIRFQTDINIGAAEDEDDDVTPLAP